MMEIGSHFHILNDTKQICVGKSRRIIAMIDQMIAHWYIIKSVGSPVYVQAVHMIDCTQALGNRPK